MRLAIIGHGRMGHEIARIAVDSGHTVHVVLDIEDNPGGAGITEEAFATVDAAIEFTEPTAAFANIDRATAIGVPLVVGTTGWEDRHGEARRLVSERRAALVYGANFSIGANLFFRVAEVAARLFDSFDGYDPYVFEHHHRHKVDAPSGTALRVAENIVAASRRKITILAAAPDGPIAAQALHVASLRAGGCPGEHRVGFDGDADRVEVVHTARSREGFARGALLAAEWIVSREGFFAFDDVLDAMLAERDHS